MFSICDLHYSIIYSFRSDCILSSILIVVRAQTAPYGIHILALIFVWSPRFVKFNKHININMSNLQIISLCIALNVFVNASDMFKLVYINPTTMVPTATAHCTV